MTDSETGRERAVLFADLSGFTALTQVHGDEDAAAVAERFAALVTAHLPPRSRLVKTIGDEVMVVADDAVIGVRAALAIAWAVDAEPLFPGVRAGLHHGPVVERGGDVFGHVVNVAARVAGYAAPGQILCTDAVAHAIEGADDVRAIPAGERHLRGIAEPIRVHEIVDAGGARAETPVDPVCRMRVPPDGGVGSLIHAGRRWWFCSLECARSFLANPEHYSRQA